MPTERDLFLWQSKTAIAIRPQRASADLLGEIRAVDFDALLLTGGRSDLLQSRQQRALPPRSVLDAPIAHL